MPSSELPDHTNWYRFRAVYERILAKDPEEREAYETAKRRLKNEPPEEASK